MRVGIKSCFESQDRASSQTMIAKDTLIECLYCLLTAMAERSINLYVNRGESPLLVIRCLSALQERKELVKESCKIGFLSELRLRSHRRMNLYILHTTRRFIPSEGLHTNARCYSCQVINSGGVRTGTIDPFPHIV